MKCSLGISNFLEEIASLSHSVVFFYFFVLIAEEGFLISPSILWNSAFRCLYLSFSPLLFTSLLFTAICVASSDSHFAFLHFKYLRDKQILSSVGRIKIWHLNSTLSQYEQLAKELRDLIKKLSALFK